MPPLPKAHFEWTPPLGKGLLWALIAVTVLDAGVQLVALLAPNPFRGIGTLAIAIIPVILFYYGALLLGIVVGVPLSIACLWTRHVVAVPAGVAILALTVVNVATLVTYYNQYQVDSERESARESASDAKHAECAVKLQQQRDRLKVYFEVPRKVTTLAGPFQIGFDNGAHIGLPVLEAREAFQPFFYERLIGSDVEVVMKIEPMKDLMSYCRSSGDSVELAATWALTIGDVRLDGKLIDLHADLEHQFPMPPPASVAASGPVRVVARWRDANSGDRTYGERGPPGYTSEDLAFSIQADPRPDSRPLYLCNQPLTRPDSPEHFLTIDEQCEGQEKVRLLGYIGSSRDAATPRALMRCSTTVNAPLRTGPRHVATINARECPAEVSVLGFVPQ